MLSVSSVLPCRFCPRGDGSFSATSATGFLCFSTTPGPTANTPAAMTANPTTTAPPIFRPRHFFGEKRTRHGRPTRPNRDDIDVVKQNRPN